RPCSSSVSIHVWSADKKISTVAPCWIWRLSCPDDQKLVVTSTSGYSFVKACTNSSIASVKLSASELKRSSYSFVSLYAYPSMITRIIIRAAVCFISTLLNQSASPFRINGNNADEKQEYVQTKYP